MKNIVLYPNPTRDTDLEVTKKTAAYLKSIGFELYLSDQLDIGDSCKYFKEAPKSGIDAMIVIGGDGTMIDAMPLAIEMQVPVIGINLGKVGYLNELEPDEICMLEKLWRDEYKIENRFLLDVSVIANGVRTDYPLPAINDIVVSRKIENTIASLRVRYNGTKALDYRADGVVVCTPLGSSAYALSCGGPMLTHELQAISLTPICPHSFLNRSMVFPDGTVIEIENLGEHDLLVIADGRGLTNLPMGGVCTVRKSLQTLRMISLKGEGHLQTIFKKLRKIQNF